MKKFLFVPLMISSVLFLSGASADFKIFDLPLKKETIQELKKPLPQRHNVPKSSDNVGNSSPYKLSEPDIATESVNDVFIFKIDTAKLKGELVPYYTVHLKTSREVYDETGARFVINAGFFDPKNEQTVSYLTKDYKLILDPHNNKNLMNNSHLKPYMDKILNRSELRILVSDSTGALKYDIAPHNDPAPAGYKIKHAIQGGPALVPELRLKEEFFVLTDKDNNVISQSASSLSDYARTLVGLKNNNVYFVTATTDNPISLPKAAQIMKAAGFEKAMAFDGGGSVSVDFRDKDIHIVSDKDKSARKLKSFFVVMPPSATDSADTSGKSVNDSARTLYKINTVPADNMITPMPDRNVNTLPINKVILKNPYSPYNHKVNSNRESGVN